MNDIKDNLRIKMIIIIKIQFITYMDLIHGFHMSNLIFHNLSMQLIIALVLTFNHLIKPTTRFLTKILKLSNVINSIHSAGTTPFG